jgi:hypothetical protein
MSTSSPSPYDSNNSNSVIFKAGSEGPIVNFFFRQCPSEFKLKIKVRVELKK